MKKYILAVIIILNGLSVLAGTLSLPREHLAVPNVTGSHLVCIWDEAANVWHAEFTRYDHSGAVSFQLPQWGKWYWVGLWDEQAGKYVFGKWVGHFISE